MGGKGRLFLGTVFVLLAVGFTWLGWRDLETQEGMKERETVTTATISTSGRTLFMEFGVQQGPA